MISIEPRNRATSLSGRRERWRTSALIARHMATRRGGESPTYLSPSWRGGPEQSGLARRTEPGARTGADAGGRTAHGRRARGSMKRSRAVAAAKPPRSHRRCRERNEHGPLHSFERSASGQAVRKISRAICRAGCARRATRCLLGWPNRRGRMARIRSCVRYRDAGCRCSAAGAHRNGVPCADPLGDPARQP